MLYKNVVVVCKNMVARYRNAAIPHCCAVALACTALTGCSVIPGGNTVSYYAQAISGQMGLLWARRDVDKILADPDTDPKLARRLVVAQDILRFAETALALDPGGRYQSYVERESDQLVWNVIAAPEFSVAPLSRCYPFVGCVPYRGYFSHKAAQAEAARLDAEYDVTISSAAAYSTLGWFNDPLLSTFIHRSDARLAELLFHELAHGVLYVKGDAGFSEAFASFVGRRGARQWLHERNGETAQADAANANDNGSGFDVEIAVYGFLNDWRGRLRQLYARDLPPETMRMLKHETLAAMQRCYEENRQHLGNGWYDGMMRRPFNNARLALVATYHDLIPGFAELYESMNGDWPAFYDEVRRIAKLEYDERRRYLSSAKEKETDGGDDQRPDQIQC